MQNAKNWFFSQPFSSQILLTIAAAMLVIFLLVEYTFDPWKLHLSNLRQSVNNDIETVAWMLSQSRQHQSKISQAKNKSNKQTDNTSSLITKIEQSAKQQKIYSNVERISPDKQVYVAGATGSVGVTVSVGFIDPEKFPLKVTPAPLQIKVSDPKEPERAELSTLSMPTMFPVPAIVSVHGAAPSTPLATKSVV